MLVTRYFIFSSVILLILISFPSFAQEEPSTLKLNPLFPVYEHFDHGFFRDPMDIFFDSKAEEIFIADTKNNLIGIFNKDGMSTFSFGDQGELMEPRHILVDKKGQIYIVDNDWEKGVKIFNYRGEFLRYFNFPKIESEEPVMPGAMTLDTKGNFYFADQNRRKVIVYNENLEYLLEFGKQGTGKGEFQTISDIAVNSKGTIYVVDSQGTPVQAFNGSGKYLFGWGSHDIGEENFSMPAAIAIDPKDRIFVVDTLRQDIKVYNESGEFILFFGGYGTGKGAVAYPVSINISPAGRVYIMEKVGKRIQVFEEVE